MKAAENIMLGIWCAAATFVTPVWLTVGFLDITGLIYQYDGMVDEGTAGIMGVIELTLWGAVCSASGYLVSETYEVAGMAESMLCIGWYGGFDIVVFGFV